MSGITRLLRQNFSGIDFGQFGLDPESKKREFLAALSGLRDFSARGFDFCRLCGKIVELLRYEGESSGLIHQWIYHAIVRLAAYRERSLHGDVLGTAGVISGFYETIFRQRTTLAGIKLGSLAEIGMRVRDKEGVEIKEFDAVSTDQREGQRNRIVTVFEFKFALSLRKLYEQVIGIDSAKVPHLVVLTTYEQFKGVRNLVYFGEVGDGHITEAITHFAAKNPRIAARVNVSKGGYSLKLSLQDVGRLLCDNDTILLARRAGILGNTTEPGSPEYRRKIREIKAIIGRKLAHEETKPYSKFDVIVAVSNAPKGQLAHLKQVLRKSESPQPARRIAG